MKQMHKEDSAATLTLKEFYDVAILFAQSIPHPKPVAIKLFYTSSDLSSAKGDGSDKKGGKGKGDKSKATDNTNSGRGTKVNTLDGTPNSVCLYHLWNSSGCNRLNPHCQKKSADICHPTNRQGTGVLHAEKAKWQPCTFRACNFDLTQIARGRCIFKHGTGDEQIANHVKTGLSSHQAVIHPPSETGSDVGAQQAHGGPPPPGGQHGGGWMSEAEFASRFSQHIDAHESRAYNNLVEGLQRAGRSGG
jgi:hypothetical protein